MSGDDGSSGRAVGRVRWELLVPLLTAAVYLPSLRSGFVNWDDDKYVQDNVLLRAPGGLARIWAGRHDLQYYPLTLTSFWLEYRAWGDRPSGYHATNVVLHAINALLVVFVARSLGLARWPSIAAGLLFGIHPLQVASVAWVTERKNVLAGVFFLASFLCYRSFRQRGDWRLYAACLAAFVLALLSKTATITLPACLWLADVLVDRRNRLRSAVGVAPMLLLALAAAIVTVLMERRATWEPLPFSVRPLVAAAAILFYVGKILLPIGLVPVYPRWAVSLTTPWLWLAAAGLAVAIGALWRLRRMIDPRFCWGLAAFVVSLSPMLGLASFGYLEHSFVADHFVYFGMVAMLCAIGAVFQGALRRGPVIVFGLLCMLLAVLTIRQQRVWADSVALWSRTRDRNPGFALGRNNLGCALLATGDLDGARRELTESIRLSPGFAPAHLNLGLVLKRRNDLEAAEREFREAVRLSPTAPQPHAMLGIILQMRRDYVGAAAAFRDAVRFAPDDPTVLNNLAWLLATCPIDAIRNGAEAVTLARRACELTRFADPRMLGTWAAAMAEAGQFAGAARLSEQAAGLALAQGQAELADVLRSRARIWAAGRSLRLP